MSDKRIRELHIHSEDETVMKVVGQTATDKLVSEMATVIKARHKSTIQDMCVHAKGQ